MSRLEARTRRLAEEVALLREQVRVILEHGLQPDRNQPDRKKSDER